MTPVSGALPLKSRLALFFGVGLQIMITVFMVRLVVDTGWRMVYPFIPQFSSGLGLTVVGFSWLIFIRSMAGMSGSLFGILADRYGRRIIMAIGLMVLVVGLVGVSVSSSWWSIGPIILFGLGATSLVPVQQAYISDQVAYEKRGRALATIDIAYPVAGIVGMPVIGWLIERVGWRSPFLLLSLLCGLAAVIVWFWLPAVSDRAHQTQLPVNFWAVLRKTGVMASVGAGGLLFLAASCFVTVWGIWLSQDFGLDAVVLGGVATAISLGELAGVSTSSLLIDRIGKRRGSLSGLAGLMLAFIALPFTQGNLFLALALLVPMGALVEFTIVSLFPLYSAQAPEARGTLFALVGLGISIGLAVGSPISAILWEQVGLWAVCAVAVICLLLAVSLVWRYLPEQPARSLVKEAGGPLA